jgi:hypothetical protein
MGINSRKEKQIENCANDMITMKTTDDSSASVAGATPVIRYFILPNKYKFSND